MVHKFLTNLVMVRYDHAHTTLAEVTVINVVHVSLTDRPRVRVPKNLYFILTGQIVTKTIVLCFYFYYYTDKYLVCIQLSRHRIFACLSHSLVPGNSCDQKCLLGCV